MMLGTSRPSGVSIATLMLWLPRMVMAVHSSSTVAFRTGYCSRASDAAWNQSAVTETTLMKKGMNESLTPAAAAAALEDARTDARASRAISSQ